MKKLLILFLALVIVGGLAFGGPINITLSATSTLKWKLAGTLLDNAPGAMWHPLASVSTAQTADFELAPATLYLSLDAQDANKMSIVRAQSTIDMTAIGSPLFAADMFDDVFHYIEFPNVVPGVVGIMLHKSAALSTAEETADSNLSYPQVLTTITPMKDATIILGFIVFPQVLHVTSVVPAVSTEVGNVVDCAVSLDATYKLALNDKDSVTIGFGTIYDTSWASGIVVDNTVANYTKDVYKAFVAKQLPAAFDEKYGWASIPFGLTVNAAISGLTVDAAAQARLVTGWDQLDKDPAQPAATQAQLFQMPLYGKLAVSYKLAMDPMTITPIVTFKYSSDFWKWWYNPAASVAAYEYLGLVAGADIIGRPMSLAVSVPVIGIAKMLDVTASATLGFGDAKHAQGAYIDPNTSAVVASTIGYTTLADYATALKAGGKDAVADAMAYKLGLVVAAKPISAVMIKNETYYNHDGFGIVGSSGGVAFAGYLNRFQDIVTGEYYVKVADAVAATFYGIATFTIKYFPDTTTPYQVVNYSVPSVTATDVSSQMTLGYEIGVKCSVTY